MENIKIIKFGGTSLATPRLQNNVVKIIRNNPAKYVIICSAMGRLGFPYSTESLMNLVDKLSLSNKEYDRLIGCGEIISSIRLSSVLNQNNIKTYALSYIESGINCDNSYSGGNIINLKDNISDKLNTYQVIIVPGFIGKSNEEEIITLGRGNSDLSAILIADILKEKEVILYKDVDGVYHTSPQVYKKLKKYSNISYNEMILLNEIGFNVVSKDALIYAKEKEITIKIKHYNEENEGTIISNISSNEKLLGFNISDKYVDFVCYDQKVVNLFKNRLNENHIFIEEELISEFIYRFHINKSIQSIIKKILFDMIWFF